MSAARRRRCAWRALVVSDARSAGLDADAMIRHMAVICFALGAGPIEGAGMMPILYFLRRMGAITPGSCRFRFEKRGPASEELEAALRASQDEQLIELRDPHGLECAWHRNETAHSRSYAMRAARKDIIRPVLAILRSAPPSRLRTASLVDQLQIRKGACRWHAFEIAAGHGAIKGSGHDPDREAAHELLKALDRLGLPAIDGCA